MTLNTFLLNGAWDIISMNRLKRGSYHSLRWTLLITYILIGFLPVLFFATTVSQTVGRYFVEERKKELLSQANIVSGNIATSRYLFEESKWPLFDEYILKTSKQGNYRIIVVDSTGTVVNDSNKTERNKAYLIPEVVEALDGKDIAKEQPNGTIYAAVSILNSDSRCVGAVLISALSTDISDAMKGIEKHMYMLLLGILFVVGIIIFFISQIFTEPLKNLIKVIRRMSEGHLELRAPVNEHTHNEISDLAIACNNMAEKLDQMDATRQNFVSNVSHELKTPLSSIKVLSESILLEPDAPIDTYKEFLEDINSEIDRMTAIINDLLTLVRLDHKEAPATFVETNINHLVEGLIKRMLPLAKQKNIEILLEEIKDVQAEVDRVKLTLAFSNLVENAIKYTNQDGTVEVSIDCDHQNAFFKVTDNGIGIAEEELTKIFERFYRVDKNRARETGGTGLGLAITHSAILMHNGSIKVSSKEGGGSVFLIRIPLRQNS